MTIEVLLPTEEEPCLDELPVVINGADPFQGDEEVKAWRERVSRRGWTGYYTGWPAKKALFGMAYADVIDFLMDRREKAAESLEYYFCLPYLSEDIDSEELDVTFEHYKASQRTENHTSLETPSVGYGLEMCECVPKMAYVDGGIEI